MTTPAIQNALTRMEAPHTVKYLVERAQQIEDAIHNRFKEGVHYGVIPGTQRKALLKPGAEELQTLFNLSSEFTTKVIDYPDGHREVRAKCSIKADDGRILAQRSAICTTRESKYRYRSQNTGAMVPGEYFDEKSPHYKDRAVLGGPDFHVRKVDGHWLIFHQIEVTNLPDAYHTVLSMAEKRAHVAAILVACGASDALVSGEDSTYRPVRQREHPQPRQQRREPHREQGRRGAPIDPEAESDDRRTVLCAMLERAGEGGMEALLDAWQDLGEKDRLIVGKAFGVIKAAVEARDENP